MSWRPAALLPLILALCSCAEGGGRGSGISTAVLGNVASVRTAARPAPLRSERAVYASTGVEGISVVIEGTGARGLTDANGNFSMQGSFEGIIRVAFQLPDGGGRAQIALNVPAGGKLTLNNVAIDTKQGVAVAETQAVDFDGTITAIDCQGLTLSLVSSQHGADDVDQYTVRLDTSSVQNAQGDPVACAAIREGEEAIVQGLVNPDGTFGNATVELTDQP